MLTYREGDTTSLKESDIEFLKRMSVTLQQMRSRSDMPSVRAAEGGWLERGVARPCELARRGDDGRIGLVEQLRVQVLQVLVANEILAPSTSTKIWVVWGLFAEIEIWTFFLLKKTLKAVIKKAKTRSGSNLGHAGFFFARVCSDGRADGQ